MKPAEQSYYVCHDAEGEFAAYYQHHEGALFIAHTFFIQNSKFKMRLACNLCTIHIHDWTEKFEQIRYEALKNFTNLQVVELK